MNTMTDLPRSLAEVFENHSFLGLALLASSMVIASIYSNYHATIKYVA